MFDYKNLIALAIAAILMSGCTITGRSESRATSTYEGDFGGIAPWTSCPPQERGTC